MRSTYSVHVIWYHFVPEPSTLFSQVPWSMLWLHPQMWPITSNPNLRVLKIEKWKITRKKNKMRKKIKKELSPHSSILTLNLKGRNFLELLDSDQNSIKLSTIKDGPWLQHFGHSNSLCTRCCSNHSSLKDKWSHNEQSSPMGYQVLKSRGITRELDKEPSLHCSSIYTITSWSILQQYVYLMSIYHTSTSYPITHLHVFFLRPPCFLHVLWCHTFNLRYIYAHHVYTMRNPCPLTSFLTLTPSRLFLILLDPKFFQTALDSVTWLPGHMPISYPFVHCRLIKYYYNIFTLS